MEGLISSLNNSKLLMGLAMLLLNVGSKYIEIGMMRPGQTSASGRSWTMVSVAYQQSRILEKAR